MNSKIFSILVTSVIVCLFACVYSTCNDLKDCFSKVRSGKLSGYTIKTFPNKGYRECFNECFQHADVCFSFNYNIFTGLCELNSQIPYSMTLIDVANFVNSLIPFAQPKDPCTLRPCPPFSMCVVLSSEDTTCVHECGSDLPSPFEMERTIQGVYNTPPYFKAGETFPFTCATQYTKHNTRICLSNGQWKHKPPLCGRETCTFEKTCPYLEDSSDALPFTKRNDETPSANTGCDNDHTTGNGYYYYLEASNTDTRTGSVFKMVSSSPFPAGVNICVGLWYHMDGDDMGSLYLEVNGQLGVLEFRRMFRVASGPQGTEWKYWSAVVNSHSSDVWVAIKGVRGPGIKSDMCLDDVWIDLC